MRAAVGRCSAVVICALMLATGAFAAAPVAPTTWYARMRFPAPPQAVLYLEIRTSGELRIADSPAALADASPLQARDRSEQERGSDYLWQYLTFSETSIPVSLRGVDKVTAVIRFNRTRSRPTPKAPIREVSRIEARVSMSMRDGQGVKWTYLANATAEPLVAGATPEQAGFLDMPDPNVLILKVDTQIEKKSARVALRPVSGKVYVDTVLKNGKPASCTLQILNSSGKVLNSGKGDLAKFGYT